MVDSEGARAQMAQSMRGLDARDGISALRDGQEGLGQGGRHDLRPALDGWIVAAEIDGAGRCRSNREMNAGNNHPADQGDGFHSEGFATLAGRMMRSSYATSTLSFWYMTHGAGVKINEKFLPCRGKPIDKACP